MSSDETEQAQREHALGDLAGRLIRAGADAVSAGAEKLREKGEEFKPRELVTGAASLGARGKDELMTLVANEVRSYMEKLRVGEEITEFLTNHSLELSVSLKPLAPKEPASPVDEEQAEPGE